MALVAQHASGAFDAFIKIGDIKGESTDAKHAEWIELKSVQWDVKREIAPPTGGGGSGREASAPKISELTITKQLDRSSPAILLNALGGSGEIPTVTLELTNTTTAKVFYRITLSDVLISSQKQVGTDSEDKPNETITFNFAKIQVDYIYTDPKGVQTTSTVTFDLAKQSAS